MRIAIAGAAGRMGQMLVREVLATPGCELAGGSEAPGHARLGEDIAVIAGLKLAGVNLVPDAASLFEADAVIDFTSPAASLRHADLAARTGKGLVIGTTGMSEADRAHVARAAEHAPIVMAPNMSLGVNLMLALVARAAAALPGFDLEILELHHKHKVDAPSGTALAIGEAAAQGRNVTLKDKAVRVRDGHTGPREAGKIGFAVLRGGMAVGDHTAMFLGEAERIEITHKAESRRIYAQGAVRAALWLQGRKPGLYGMSDVLGLG